MELRLERMLGRPVLALNGRRIGRLEELQTRGEGSSWVVVEYAIGPAGLWERLGIGARLVLGGRGHGYRVGWDQLPLSEEEPLRLSCSVDELHPI